jgi:hypothetical protein
MAKSASPSRVRQAPPEPRCWTLTGRMVRSAWSFVKMSRSGPVAKRRIRSSKVRNLWARRRASFRGSGAPVQVRGESGGGECPVAGEQVFQDGRFQGGLAG